MVHKASIMKKGMKMKKYFKIFSGKTLVTCFFADECEPAFHGLGLLTKGCTDWDCVKCTVSLPDLIVVEEKGDKRILFAAYVESYTSTREDGHSHFAELLGFTRHEAKKISYEIIYRGCRELVEVTS